MKNKLKGFYVYGPKDCEKMNYLINLMSRKLKDYGYLQNKFPRIGDYVDFKKQQSHFQLNSEVFKLEGSKKYLVPTSEVVAYSHIYADKSTWYPFKWFDYGPVWRNESKATKKYVRNKEIAFFFELHAIFSNESDAKKEFELQKNVFTLFFKHIGLKKIKIVLRPPEDTFAGAKYTIAFDYPLKVKKEDDTEDIEYIQLGSVHFLGDNFNEAFNPNAKTEKTYTICAGFSQRILGVLKKVYGDNYDLIHDKKPLIVYFKDDLTLNQVKIPELNVFVKTYVKLSKKIFNSHTFSRYEALMGPTYALKIGSHQDLVAPIIKCLKTNENLAHVQFKNHYFEMKQKLKNLE